MRQVRYFGCDQVDASGASDSPIYTGAAPLPIFPDQDLVGVQRSAVLSGFVGRFLALAPETDWDDLIVYINGKDLDPVRLLPGMLYEHDEPIVQLRAVPPILTPSTRLYNAKGLDVAGRAPTLPAGQSWEADGVGIKNTGAAAVQLYTWNGAAWVAGNVCAAGAYVTNGATTVTIGGAAAADRPADVSPDGKSNFADLIATDVVPQNFPGTLMVSVSATDSNGNPGDPTVPTTIPYVSTYRPPVSSHWYGVAAIEVWDQPPCGYQPRLPSVRTFRFAGGILPSAVPGTPDQAQITVPGLNVERAQFTWTTIHAMLTASWGAIGSPLWIQRIDVPAFIMSTPDKAVRDGGAAVAVLENVHDLVQVVMGSDSNAQASAFIGELVCQRRFVR